MPAVPAIIGAVGAVGGAAISSHGATSAARAQQNAADAASAEQRRQYDLTRSDQAPWRQRGGQAVDAIAQFLGLPAMAQGAPVGANGPGALAGNPSGGFANGRVQIPEGLLPRPQAQGVTQGSGETPIATASHAAAPDYNQILSNLPGYQFQLQQGQQAVERNLAARGLLNSGAAGKALTQYGQGIAQNYSQQYLSGLESLAGLGQSSVQATGAAGANAANQIGGNLAYGGNAAASGYVGQANAINSGLSGLAGIYGAWQQGRNQQQLPEIPSTPYNPAQPIYNPNIYQPLPVLGGP